MRLPRHSELVARVEKPVRARSRERRRRRSPTSPLSTVRRVTSVMPPGPIEGWTPSYSNSFTMDNLLSELEWRGLVYDATEGLADAARQGAGDRVHRLRSDGVEPSRRLAAHGDGARAAAAVRPHADRDRRRRHRHDWRSERQVAGAAAAVARADRRERRRHPAAARAVSRLRRAGQCRAHREQRRLARPRSICSASCATPASTSP